jgi:hypothetical protein
MVFYLLEGQWECWKAYQNSNSCTVKETTCWWLGLR